MYFYSGGGSLAGRRIYKPDEGESLNYDGAGRLRQRIVTVEREDGTREVTFYNGDGSLYGRSIRRPSETGMNSKGYDETGALRGETAVLNGASGARVEVEQLYDPSGTPTKRVVSATGRGANEREKVAVRPDGTQTARTRETHERDSRGNLVRSVKYAWDKGAGEFVPYEVFYYTVTYYR
jgi:hypothetical protein